VHYAFIFADCGQSQRRSAAHPRGIHTPGHHAGPGVRPDKAAGMQRVVHLISTAKRSGNSPETLRV
jgi:hypothetical protein